MTTATKAVTAPATTSTIDFDTRLVLARIAIDVACERHGTVEADAAVTEAGTHVATVTEAGPERVGHTVLRAAGDLIRARGWVQGEMVAESGALCALGAIHIAASLTGASRHDAAQVLTERIGRSVIEWNDQYGRTEAEVLSMLW